MERKVAERKARRCVNPQRPFEGNVSIVVHLVVVKIKRCYGDINEVYASLSYNGGRIVLSSTILLRL